MVVYFSWWNLFLIIFQHQMYHLFSNFTAASLRQVKFQFVEDESGILKGNVK